MKFSLGQIAEKLNLSIQGDASVEIHGIANLLDAQSGQLAFLFSSGYQKYLHATKASAVVLTEADAVSCPTPALISSNPRLAWAHIAALYDPAPVLNQSIHASAVISPSAILGSNITIGANVIIEAGARLDQGVSIGPGCFVGENVVIENDTRINANVSIYHGVKIGKNNIIHSGAVIGADGFGFEFDAATGTLVKIPQIYAVQLGNKVEVGAGTTIDRGALNHTVIADGVKLDNQVQIGHGTVVGTNTAISGCTAIAGSTKIGANCLIGGAVGIVDNIEIVDQVQITAMSLVSQSILTSGRFSSGTGLMPARKWRRSVVGFAKLDELIKRIRALEIRARDT